MPPSPNVLELLLRRRAAEEGVPVDESGAPLFPEDAARLAGTAGTLAAPEAPPQAPPSAPNIFERLRQQSAEARALREESRDDLQSVSATTSRILKGFMAQALRNDRDIIEEFEEQRKKPGLAKNILARFMLGVFSSDPNLKTIRDVQLRRFMQKKQLQFAADERRRKDVETAMRLLGVQERGTESVFSNDAAFERQASQQLFLGEESLQPPSALDAASTRLKNAQAATAEGALAAGPTGEKFSSLNALMATRLGQAIKGRNPEDQVRVIRLEQERFAKAKVSAERAGVLPLVEAVSRNPQLFGELGDRNQTAVLPSLVASGFDLSRLTARPLPQGMAQKLIDGRNSIASLRALRQNLKDNADLLGGMAAFAADASPIAAQKLFGENGSRAAKMK